MGGSPPSVIEASTGMASEVVWLLEASGNTDLKLGNVHSSRRRSFLSWNSMVVIDK
ncbi:hypothetical protein L916_08020 [Phytophthora nicotianae]|uniref:Uncharacterized protein n=1 Tax=Phytophthora nicotianae TaxID=4792 RepID=W2J5M7_PHYNI|nr:hypothetical protein L916_08020 [Phytophthora nicotianae]